MQALKERTKEKVIPLKLSTTIPFSGFYESSHSDEIDREIENYFDKEGDGNQDHTPQDFYWSFKHYHDIQIKYAALYVRMFEAFFNDETGLDIKLTFEEMTSPREYNFTTDRIFTEISFKDVKKLRKYVSDSVLEKHIKKRFTSRDGFSSFYPNDFNTWQEKPLSKWDHNEIGTLIEAALDQCGYKRENLAFDVMEYAMCNGRIYDIVYPYCEAWEREHPIESSEDRVKDYFDILDSNWDLLSNEEKEEKVKEYTEATYRCETTLDLFNVG